MRSQNLRPRTTWIKAAGLAIVWLLSTSIVAAVLHEAVSAFFPVADLSLLVLLCLALGILLSGPFHQSWKVPILFVGLITSMLVVFGFLIGGGMSVAR